MSRLPLLTEAELSEPQRAVWAAIVEGPRGRVEAPLNLWLRSPEMAGPAQALGAYCRYGSALPRRLSELAILVTAAWWKAAYEWAAHAPAAVAAGLDPQCIEALRTGAAPRFTEADEQAVHDVASELLSSRMLSPATYARAEAALGARGLVDLVAVLGYYGFISMTLKAFAMKAPDGKDPFA